MMRFLVDEADGDDSVIVTILASLAYRQSLAPRGLPGQDAACKPLAMLVACARQTTLAKVLLSLAIAGVQARAPFYTGPRGRLKDRDDKQDGDAHADGHCSTDRHINGDNNSGRNIRGNMYADAIVLVVDQAPPDTAQAALTLAASLSGCCREAAHFLAQAVPASCASDLTA